jgi:hypothetical protein
MKLLTTKNIKKGMWINDPTHGLSQIIHVHKSVARFMDETPFTYKIYLGHRCYTSATLSGTEYKIGIVPRYRVYVMKKLKTIKNLFK